MKNVTRTIWGAALQSYQLAGLAYQTPPFTTLNELYNVQSGVQPAKTPAVGFLAVGNGAHYQATGVNGFPLMPTLPHFATDAALFNGIPLCVRPLTADLTPAEMAKYAMRVVKPIGGVMYACYYLKVIDLSQVVPQIMYNANNNGVITPTPYAATSNNLNPVKPNLGSNGLVQTSADYLTVQMIVDLSFTANDVAELDNVATVLYGDTRYAIISEMAVCSGQLQPAVGQAASGTFTYNEAFGVQVHSFISDYIAAGDSDTGFDLNVNMGASEPLLTVTQPTLTSAAVTSS